MQAVSRALSHRWAGWALLCGRWPGPPRGRECAPQGCVAAAPQNCFMAGSASRLGPLAVSRGRDGARELDSACSPGAVQHVGRGIVGHGHAGV